MQVRLLDHLKSEKILLDSQDGFQADTALKMHFLTPRTADKGSWKKAVDSIALTGLERSIRYGK